MMVYKILTQIAQIKLNPANKVKILQLAYFINKYFIKPCKSTVASTLSQLTNLWEIHLMPLWYFSKKGLYF